MILVFTVMKFIYINTIPLWMDEGLTFYYVSADTLTGLFARIFQYEKNPVFFYILTWGLVKVFNSTGVWVLRLSPFIFSILSPVFLFKLYKQKFNDERGAVIASTFLFISQFFTLMTCDARGYSQAVFFIILGSYYYFMLLKKEKMSFLVFCLSWIIALKTHFFSGLILAVIFLHYLVFNRKENTIDFATGFSLIFISLIPEFVELSIILKVKEMQPGWPSLSALAETFFAMMTGFTLEFPSMIVWYVILTASVVFVLLPILRIREKMPARVLVLAIFYTYIILMFVIPLVFKMRFFSVRHMVLILPFYAVLLSLSLQSINVRAIKLILIFLIVVINFLSTRNIIVKEEYHRNDFRIPARLLRENIRQGDAVVLINGYLEYLLEYYYPGVNDYEFLPIRKPQVETFNIRQLEDNPRVWFIISHPSMADPRNVVAGKILEKYKPVKFHEVKKKNSDFSIKTTLLKRKNN
ncbi:MAG: glycosyltransferase family 39 protein [Vulcanimicrobiota bacterium]